MAVRLKDITLEQFLELPEEKPALEFADGRITQKVSPKGKHSQLQIELAMLIQPFARPRKLARAYPELRVTYGGRSLVPDLSVFRWSRVPVDPNGEIADDFTEPPDLVFEIMSPKQGRRTLIEHSRWFVASGVSAAFVIEPAGRIILGFRPDQPMATLTGSDRLDFDDVLPGFVLTVQDVFDLLKVD